MSVLDATQLQKSYGPRNILSDVSVTLSAGERVGLVGLNGSGKSTLGRILCGVETPDAGAVALRRGARVDYLAQEPVMDAALSIREVVQSSFEDWTRAKCRYDEITLRMAKEQADSLIAEQARAADEIERLGGWDRLHEADSILGHLGLEDPTRLVGTLSGGERRRVALACVLVGRPDLAILDEPTNHLDVATIEWLEEHLSSRFRGALLLISHDRELLDRVTTRTLELEHGTLHAYRGGYVDYLEAKAEREAHAERSERNRQNFLRRELEWLRRQPKARGTKQKARIDRAEFAMDTPEPRAQKQVDLRLDSERAGKTILNLLGLRVERDGRLLIDGLDLALGQGQRVGVIGPNGSGKSSLLAVLLGELEAAAGEFTLGANTRIGHLDQVRSGLDDSQSVRECVAEGGSEVETAGERISVETYLDRFLFDRAAQRVKVGQLSGGERARVCLARLMFQKTNLLLLDEPTNDLDVSTLMALESTLVDYQGSALIVSHDRWFLDRVATSLLVFEGDGKVELHPGNYSAYRERVARRKSVETDREAVSRPARTLRKAPNSTPKKLSFREQRELDRLFEQIELAEAEVARLEAQLADPQTYRQQGAEVAELQRSCGAARENAAKLTQRWEELEAKQAAFAAGA